MEEVGDGVLAIDQALVEEDFSKPQKMQKEEIEYEVTLKGFWSDMEKRIWKAKGGKRYIIDANNYATLLEPTCAENQVDVENRSEAPNIAEIISFGCKKKTRSTDKVDSSLKKRKTE